VPSEPLAVDPIALASANWRRHGWGSAADGMAFVTSIVRAQQILMALVDPPLRTAGLSFARFEILRLLAFSRDGRLPIGTVGRRLQVHPASVTSAVDRLERDGLVTRERAAGDRRRVLVELTPDGRELCERVTLELNRCFESIEVPDEDLAATIGVLVRLREANGDFRGR
jgi:DNA-binding MarR family transcriptional regulator